MKLKRFFLTLLVLSLTLCAFVVTASAAETVESGKCGDNLTWTFDSDGTLTISGTGPMYDYVYDGHDHSSSYEPWADLSFTKIVVESGVTTIGDGAFDDSSDAKVSSISLPNTLTSIGAYAFAYSEMETITVPNSVTSIGNSAFDQCRSLKTIRLPNKLKSISDEMFSHCNALESLVIPESVTSIGNYAFYWCISLREVILPSNLKTIHSYAFWFCDALEIAILPDSVTSIGDSAFDSCASLQAAYLPQGLKKIPFAMFRGCTSLQEVVFPIALQTIEYEAFRDCNNLSVIYFPGTEEQLENLEIAGGNDPLYDAAVYLVTLITKQPQDTRVLAGTEVSFSTAASRKDVTYQWYYAESIYDEWKPCKSASAKTDTLTFVATASKDGYWYCCEITDSYGNVGSTQAVQLTIAKPAKITTQPKNAVAPSGTTAKITVKASGEGLKYQWYFKDVNGTKFSKSSITTATYSLKMSSGNNGRQVYCVVTDKYGTKVQSDTVTLYMGNPAKITAQPKNAAAPSGTYAKATVKATGDGLKYQWYIKDVGGSKFGKSSITSATYSLKMSSANTGRQVYCVVTDKYGTSVKTNTVTLHMGNPAKITTQPKNAVATSGTYAKATVKATGDGLTYQWYIKDVGGSKFGKSSITSATYSLKMSSANTGRQVYCVVTDKYGTSVQSNTVTLYMGNPAKITAQPKNAVAPNGTIAKVTLSATGDGLTYKWYYKDVGGTKFGKSSFAGSTYSLKMSSANTGRQVYCVVTDKYGNSVQSNTVTLTMGNPAKITVQPKNAAAPSGTIAKVTLAATGDGLTYKWYFKDVGGSKFGKSSFTGATYSLEMSSSNTGRQVYCVVTDKYGNSVQSNTVTLHMGNPAKITTQPKNATAPSGSKVKVTIAATGDGLTYKWYYKDTGASKFSLTTTFTGNSYSVAMDSNRSGRQVYCVVTDRYGTTVQTKTVTLTMENPS